MPFNRLYLSLFMLLVAARCALAAPTYVLKDLGPISNGENTPRTVGINNVGQAVGEVTLNNLPRAAIFQNNALTYLDSLPGAQFSNRAFAINESGLAVGWSATDSSHARAVAWDAGVATDLGSLGGNLTFAFGVNSAGDAVGMSELFGLSGTIHDAVLFRGGSVVDLGRLPGDQWGEAYGINDSGVIVGVSVTGIISAARAVQFLGNNAYVDLGSLPGATNSVAFAINEVGQAVGYSGPAHSSNVHAVMFFAGKVTDLGVLPAGDSSEALDINNNVTAVGEASGRAALFNSGSVYDLKSLIDPSVAALWSLERATGINDSGLITGVGRFGNAYHAFLLTPVPEPSSLVLSTLVIFLFSAHLLRQKASRRGRSCACCD